MHPLNSHPLIQQYNASNKFGDLLGISYIITEKGKVKYNVSIEEKHLATPFAAHGGLVATLCDSVLGIAALSCVVEEERIVATVEMNIKYIRPVLIKDVVTAYSEVIKAGKRLLFSEAKVFNQKNELVAVASGTFNAYPKEKAAY
ncbi:MAG: phenylacetic acid degradation-related protein [Crocinitomicaceae bacterium]|jgi:acyl-CoA thioesterase|nr:phenylacetic acid degradation-related protein [Crocinitomicaceae bacterium]